MGAAAAIGGAAINMGGQAYGAAEQADVARETTTQTIDERETAARRAGELSEEGQYWLGHYGDLAADEVRKQGGAGLSALDTGYRSAMGSYGQAGGQAMSSLAQGYGGAEQAMLGGYGSALSDYARMAPAADVVGRSGIMGLNEGSMQRGFATDPGAAWQMQQGMSGLTGGGSARDAALAKYNQGLAAQGYGNFAQREMQAQGIGLGALEAQAGRQDIWNRGQTSALAQLGMQGGTDMANYLSQAGQGIAGQQWGTGSSLAALEQQRAAETYGALSGLGTQLGSLYSTTGSNLAAALTGQGQLGARLATGIDRSALVNAAGGAARDIGGLGRDIGQLGYLLSQGGGGGNQWGMGSSPSGYSEDEIFGLGGGR
jgi:hypothetical protein